MKNTWKISVLLVALFVSFQTTKAQEKQYKVACVAFYNLENLFDTIVDTNPNIILADEFTPKGRNNWTSKRYKAKLLRMADVISQIGGQFSPQGPAVIGVSEIENRQVLEDLVNTPKLKARHYKIIHFDSPDRRGIDLALLYRATAFKPTSQKAFPLIIADKPDFYTRSQLLVTGLLDGEEMHFIVNHWPSRRGGEKRSRPLRNAAADLSRSIADSILEVKPNAKIIIMGDLNDDPTNESLRKHLKAKGKIKKMKAGDFYNPMMEKFKNGNGTLAYRDSWSLFDQLIITPALINSDKGTYKFLRAKIFKNKKLTQKEGKYKGYPLRTYAGGTFQGGYSDHFPVYLLLVKEID